MTQDPIECMGSNSDIVTGLSPAMQTLRNLVHRIAPTSATVLIRGESGTGKELLARSIHRLSTRSDQPFVKIDCASLPDNLIESELFGYESGAFTGAVTQKIGRVQLAQNGTLFLDEIGELSPHVQCKLLRLLQDRQFERLGGNRTFTVNVRVVAATHRDLESMVRCEQFRQDLYYRLNVLPLWTMPLRNRSEDIGELARHFCAKAGHVNGRAHVHLDNGALRLLTNQRWPGNVRQLENFVERVVVLCAGSTVSAADVERELACTAQPASDRADTELEAPPSTERGRPVLPLEQELREAEQRALRRALKGTHGNRSAAARLLGVSRSTLYSKLETYGMI